PGPRRLRRPGDGGVRTMARYAGSGSLGPARLRWRPVLEAGSMNAGDIVDRIRERIGTPWRDTSYSDTDRFGGSDTEVTGVATTVFVSMEVIEKAAADGLNMNIPHEDTFWNDRDDVTVVSGDPLYAEKVALLHRHNIVIFRIHDH